MRYKPNATNQQQWKFIYALATIDSVVIYDTEHLKPLVFLSDLHYAALTDIAWSNDGLSLMMTSTDGFCSLVEFTENELGVVDREYKPVVLEDKVQDISMECNPSHDKSEMDLDKPQVIPADSSKSQIMTMEVDEIKTNDASTEITNEYPNINESIELKPTNANVEVVIPTQIMSKPVPKPKKRIVPTFIRPNE